MNNINIEIKKYFLIIKKIIHSFIPPILSEILVDIKLLMKNIWSYSSTFLKYKKLHKDLLIIGNGPSLRDTIIKNNICFEEYDVFAMNFFAITDLFEKVKPNMYLFVDPIFYMSDELIPEDRRKSVRKLKETLLKIQWDLSLFIPNTGNYKSYIDIFSNNKHIHIYTFNMKNILKPGIIFSDEFLMKNNLSPLPAQNVLNTCLSLGILLHYESIYFIGADSSWLLDLKVDQSNNDLLSLDNHFYSTNKEQEYIKLKLNNRKEFLHEQLKFQYIAFKNYYLLNNFAKKNGVNIYNASEFSLIDSIDRKKIPKK